MTGFFPVTRKSTAQNPYSSALALIGAIPSGRADCLALGQGNGARPHAHGRTRGVGVGGPQSRVARLQSRRRGRVFPAPCEPHRNPAPHSVPVRALKVFCSSRPKKLSACSQRAARKKLTPPFCAPGDMVRVLPGENIAADGPRAARPDYREPGQHHRRIASPSTKPSATKFSPGTNNVSGAIEFEVTRAGEDTHARPAFANSSSKRKPPAIPSCDSSTVTAVFYTPTILMIAGTVLYFTRDFERAVTMLVVSCLPVRTCRRGADGDGRCTELCCAAWHTYKRRIHA